MTNKWAQLPLDALADTPWWLIRHNKHVKNLQEQTRQLSEKTTKRIKDLEAQLQQRAEEDSYVQRLRDFWDLIFKEKRHDNRT